MQIKQEFEMLHQILNIEEVFRIAALKNEEEKKKQMLREKIEKINRDITSLNELIQSVSKGMSANDLLVLQVGNLYKWKPSVKNDACRCMFKYKSLLLNNKKNIFTCRTTRLLNKSKCCIFPFCFRR